MQCLGRVGARRCGNKHVRLFCRHHRWQAFTALLVVVSPIAIFAGLYQDAIKPLIESVRRYPQSTERLRLTHRLQTLKEQGRWAEIRQITDELAIEGQHQDVVSYFRGLEAQHNSASLDNPVSYFEKVPPDSDLFIDAARKRFFFASRSKDSVKQLEDFAKLKTDLRSGPKALSPYSLVIQALTCNGLGCCANCSTKDFLAMLEPFEREYAPRLGSDGLRFEVCKEGSITVDVDTMAIPASLYIAETLLAAVASQEGNLVVATLALQNTDRMERDYGLPSIKFMIDSYFGMPQLFARTLDIRNNIRTWSNAALREWATSNLKPHEKLVSVEIKPNYSTNTGLQRTHGLAPTCR